MKYRYFPSKAALLDAVRAGNDRGYNRQLDADLLDAELIDGDKYPISFTMEHNHIAGQEVEPHVRAMVVLNSQGETALLDMATETFNALPERESFDPGEAQLATDTYDGSHRIGGRR